MNSYEVSREAQGDLFDIWRHIARTDADLAERIEAELYAAFEALAATPGMGHTRKDLTRHAMLFFPVYS